MTGTGTISSQSIACTQTEAQVCSVARAGCASMSALGVQADLTQSEETEERARLQTGPGFKGKRLSTEIAWDCDKQVTDSGDLRGLGQ